MKITTINVNQFIGIDNWRDYKNVPDITAKKWNLIKNDWFAIINDKLSNETDILFLHEVPFKMYPGTRSLKESVIYEELINFCKENMINVFMTNDESTIFKTIALSKKKYEYVINSEKMKEIFRVEASYFEDSRIIMLKNRKNIIIGMHNPSTTYNSIVFLNSLKELVKQYCYGFNVICCGDINIYESEILLKKEKEFLKYLELKDAWIYKGFANDDDKGMTFYRFEKGELKFKNRIDKFFINENISNYEIKVDKSIVDKKLSDHNALTLEILI